MKFITMKSIIHKFALLAVVLTLGQCTSLKQVSSFESKPKVSVYYEAFNAKSRQFVLEQLHPTVQLLSGYIGLELIPYGNTHFYESPHGFPRHTCPYSMYECMAHRIQACLFDFVDRETEVNLVVPVETLACMFKVDKVPETSNGTETLAQICIEKGMKVDVFPTIQQCSSSAYAANATKLQDVNRRKTRSLAPKYSHVPWIAINQVHTAELQEAAQKDLLNLLCERYLAKLNLPQCN